ncbi:PREDICTED: putative disease resistance protein At3g14460 [Theobroma cacao]|uniref:Disease resistance protein At3g14460 n=1 Tax=Theobroma cacao TaxID=3641 RepID=A0AB32WM05_THECC|nr:PREDICTED: putative disease resistance protein At3g14460 [Theobroma cacao]
MKARLQPMSSVDDTNVHGREKEKAEILELLSNNNGNENEASLIHIVGIGGIGKTTLAQLVYNDNSINQSFDYKAWICVSKDFDTFLVTKTILQSITDEYCIVPSLDTFQVMLQEKLFGKRFLLVLDNVWSENYDDLTILLKPFGVGTKIIVTTRSCKVSSVVSTVEAYPLLQLSEKDCLSVFTHCALQASNFSGHPELEKVGESIVKKCNGLPLAAKAIGGLLCTQVDHGVWKDISESEIWDLPEEQCGVIPALLLSYKYLPPYLKRCFAYCSLLPKDYEFEEEELILLWKAEGFLQEANSKTQMEGLGSQYFQDLVSRSFIQTSSRDKSRFVMHDLINDLAQFVAGEICFRLEGNKQPKISEGIRHASYVRGLYDGVKKFEAFNQMKCLRTFLPFMLPTYGECFLTNTVLVDLLPKLRCLRVLSLKGYCITQLPNLFENLIHLRYLDFSYTAIKSLPDSICSLYNLETLQLRKCFLEKLPSDIELLVNLNHLDITGSKSMKRMPFGIGKLINLQRLSNFVLGEGDGHQMQEIKSLHLKGDLSLSGLENIVKAQDAWEARLIDKSGLDGLQLMWSTNFNHYIRNKAVEEEVLNMLEPHRKLKRLIIENYGGTNFPKWIADSSLKYLLSLNLNNCKNCKLLPSIGNLPLLKDLSIRGMHDVSKVGIEFYGENQSNAFAPLERLCFEDMPKWKEWDLDEVGEQLAKFPCLREFCIVNCPQLLGRLPNSLYSLETLVIRRCSELVVSVSNLPMLYDLEIDGCAELVLRDYADFPSLRRVSLSNILKLCTLTERLVSRLKSLEHLKINGCKEMTSSSWKQLGSVEHLSTLRGLEIWSFPQLVLLEPEEVEEEQLQLRKPCNIESLTIGRCERLERLPEDLHFLTFLTGVRIEECPCIVSFSKNNWPPALKWLVIKSCVNLQCMVDAGEYTGFSNTCLLQHLEIIRCPSLIRLSLPIRLQILKISRCTKLASLSSSGELPTGLKQLLIVDCTKLEYIVQAIHENSCLEHLRIWGCKNIKFLPRGLNKLNHVQKIELWRCENLVSLTESGLPAANLTVLRIGECHILEALPNMQNLSALKELMLQNCSPLMSFLEEGFPTNLTSLSISVPQLCSSLLKWGLHKLTSLKDLYINGEECPDVVSFPLEGRGTKLPPSLTSITMKNFEKLRCLSSKGFQNLTSLQELWIFDCPNLTSLPEKDVLLSLSKLYMWNCPLLTYQCIWPQGREWLKISHIPEVLVDHQSIIPKASWTIQP